MKLQYIAIAFVVIVVLISLLYLFSAANNWSAGNTTIGTIRHSVILHFLDGTTSEMGAPLSVFSDDKAIESITYYISGESYGEGTISLGEYIPAFSTPFGTYVPEVSSEEITANSFSLIYAVSMWKLVNYILEDGTYDIVLTPSGTIHYNGEATTVNLNPIEFALKIKDDRTLVLTFN